MRKKYTQFILNEFKCILTIFIYFIKGYLYIYRLKIIWIKDIFQEG